ncbi:MAG: hypothetical protein ACJ8EN_10940 [Xanthobacteraceae bacterium]
MLRKTIIALAATAMLGGVALAPTAASAGGMHHHHHHRGFGWGFYAGPRYVPADCYWVKKQTAFGIKLVPVCNYV